MSNNIARALRDEWQRRENVSDKRNWTNPPLEYFLKYNYDKYYLPLCHNMGINPKKYGEWLRTPIESLT